jgi:hypothetical protein
MEYSFDRALGVTHFTNFSKMLVIITKSYDLVLTGVTRQ